MADTSLFTLFPTVPALVGGERVEVRPVILSELPLVERVLEGWRVLVATSGEVMPQESWDAFSDLLASACGKSREWVLALQSEDFERLSCLVLAQNRELWDGEAQESKGDDYFAWPQVVQRLVRHGHPWQQVQSLTLGQIRDFMAEALVIEREDLAQVITAASFAMADGSTVQKVTKELRRG